MSNVHASDCAINNAPAYEPGVCNCLPTPQMCRAAVEYMNGAEVYAKLPAKLLEIEESIYAEVWKAMQSVAPMGKDKAPGLLREALAWIENSQEPAPSLCGDIRNALGMPANSEVQRDARQGGYAGTTG